LPTIFEGGVSPKGMTLAAASPDMLF